MNQYHVYITTNPKKSGLYTGVTNNLKGSLMEHYRKRVEAKSFAGKNFCYCLVYHECHHSIETAIEREKEIMEWGSSKKETLINATNPDWDFLNSKITYWPPELEVSEMTI